MRFIQPPNARITIIERQMFVIIRNPLIQLMLAFCSLRGVCGKAKNESITIPVQKEIRKIINRNVGCFEKRTRAREDGVNGSWESTCKDKRNRHSDMQR